MTIRGERAELDGTTITIQADSEEAARAAFDAAENARLQAEGTTTQKLTRKLDKWFDDLEGFNSSAQRNTAHIISWVLLVIGGAFAFKAGANLFPDPALAPLFGIAAVCIVAAGKFAAGRWAKLANKGEDKAADSFRNIAVVCVLISFLMGFSLQASNMVNRDTGAQANKEQIDANESALRRMRLEADEMDRPRETVAQIERELAAMKSRPAINYNGREASFNIAEAVEDGTETYCRGSNYYKNKYCPDLLDIEGALEARKIYEQKLSDIAAMEGSTATLRSQHAELSSSEAVGAFILGDGVGKRIWSAAAAALLILLIDFVMVGASYFAHRYPKGA